MCLMLTLLILPSYRKYNLLTVFQSGTLHFTYHMAYVITSVLYYWFKSLKSTEKGIFPNSRSHRSTPRRARRCTLAYPNLMRCAQQPSIVGRRLLRHWWEGVRPVARHAANSCPHCYVLTVTDCYTALVWCLWKKFPQGFSWNISNSSGRKLKHIYLSIRPVNKNWQ